MERTARLVRSALRGRPTAPDPWARVAADVAAAVARSTSGSAHEGAHAAGGPGGVSSLDLPHAVLRAARGSGLEGTHDTGGPGGVCSREVAHAVLQAARGSGREGTHGAGGPGGVSGRELVHAELRAGRGSGLEGTHDVGVPGGGSGRELASAVPRTGRGSGREGTHAVARKGKGSGSANQFGVHQHATHDQNPKEGPGEREAKEYHQQVAQDDGKGGQAEPVASKAKDVAAGSGRGLSLAAYLLNQGADAPSCGSASEKVCCVHDKSFLSRNQMRDWDCDDASVDEPWSTDVDVSDKITSRLTKSAEPVISFRIDSSKWKDSTCLEVWLDLVSEKSVQEVDLLNLGHKVTSVFPIHSLQSKCLQTLRIGFLTLQLDLFCFNYSSLRALEFFCCTIETSKLSWVITDCVSLENLKVCFCCMDLKIKSDSLKTLESRGNIGNRIVIEAAPKLESLISGMEPKQQSKLLRQRIKASISLNIMPSVKVMKLLSLAFHKITVNSKEITKVVGPLPSLEVLEVSLEMSNVMQLQNLRQLLHSFTGLQDLSIVRMDQVGRDEGLDVTIDKPFEDLHMVQCVKSCLMAFSVQDFRAGPSEKHLIQCVLKSAPNLKQVRLRSSESASKRSVGDAVKVLRNCHRASEDCGLILEGL